MFCSLSNSLSRLVPVLGLLVLVSLPDQAQIYPGGGIGFPGGGGGGIGFPGGGIGRGRRGNQNQMPTDNFLGVIQQISQTQLTMSTDDRLTITVMLTNSTKYVKENGNNGRNGDFSQGDRISVDSSQDNNGNNRAIKVTQIRVGSAEDKSAAQGRSTTTSTGSSSGSSGGSSNDDDPDRPRLHRADNSGNVSSNNPPPSAPPASSSTSSTASVRPPSAPVYDDDAPVLRRGRPQQTASASDDSASSGARPSIHAEEVNGVTQAPPPPRVDSSGDNRGDNRGFTSLPRDSGDPTIEQARAEVFQFSETLPNYVVKQYTTRYETNTASAKTSWAARDNITADVIEENGVERYKNILVNGKAPREAPEKTGSWSSGEFSSLLQDVFASNTNAEFHGKRATTINSRSAFRYDFSVEQPNSHWHVETGGQSYLPAYSGTVWIDKETLRVLRVEMAAQSMPRNFPLDTVESAVDYDFVLIGDTKFLLPTHSEALSCERNSRACSRNVIDFRNYRKFAAESSITFDPDHE
jgi:hypothetical protein